MDTKDALRFLFAGAANMTSAMFTNPIDVIKVRLQLDNELSKQANLKSSLQSRYYKGFVRGGIQIVKDEGIRGLYKGTTASLMREGSYSTIRIGAYEPVKRLLGATDRAHTPLYKKVAAGAVTGAFGSAIATPTDLVKIRMQAQGKLAEGEKPRYSSAVGAFRVIFAKEGVRGLWTGIVPTVQRAAILTATQIPSYDHTKHTLLNYGLMEEGPRLHIVSSVVAGFLTTVTISPVDIVKTRLMNQDKLGNKKYTSVLDVMVKTVRNEGFHAFFKGFFPNWARLAPHSMISFYLFEKWRSMAGIEPV